MKKKKKISFQIEKNSLTALVEDYSEKLKKYLETGQKKPDPQSFLDRCNNKSKRSDLKIHLNLSTLLSLYGVEKKRKAREILKNEWDLVQGSKRMFLGRLPKKSSGIH